VLSGNLPSNQIGAVPGTNQSVRSDLVAQVAAWRAAFHTRFGKPMSITDGYRTYALQEAIFRKRYTTVRLPGRPRLSWNGVTWYQKPFTAIAAVPGYSNHGYGTALDLGSGINIHNSAEWRWCVDYAPYFGFRWPVEWANRCHEWWHFEDGTYVPPAKYRNIPGANVVPPTPAAIPTKEIPMFVIVNSRSKVGALIYSNGLWCLIASGEDASVIARALHNTVESVSEATFIYLTPKNRALSGVTA
jgi:hypothetical protein